MKGKIEGCAIFSAQKWINGGYLTYQDSKIQEIGTKSDSVADKVYHFPENYKCLPGMIDMHIHGAAGADTMDATPEALKTIADVLPKEATTAFLATTITQSKEAIEKALVNAAKVIGHQKQGEAEIIGIHLEGPFINRDKAGAQPSEFIIDADIECFDHWQELAQHHIKEVTVAPEIKGGLAFIRHLSDQGVVASIGHSNGLEADVRRAAEAGATQVTHLFNGMRGLHHREPGILGGALMQPELFAEIISDGRHVAGSMINLAYRLKGSRRMILITDAMRAKCLKNGTYDLGGQKVHVQDGLASLSTGTIAGSVLKMNQGIENFLAFTNASLEDIVQMGSVNPALQCGVFDRKGSLEEGKDADLIILDDQNRLVMTVCRGTVAYYRKDGGQI